MSFEEGILRLRRLADAIYEEGKHTLNITNEERIRIKMLAGKLHETAVFLRDEHLYDVTVGVIHGSNR